MSRHEKPSTVLPIGTRLLLVSRVQAAELLSVSPALFDRLRKQHAILAPVRVGTLPRWPLKSLEAFVANLIDSASGDDPWEHAAL